MTGNGWGRGGHGQVTCQMVITQIVLHMTGSGWRRGGHGQVTCQMVNQEVLHMTGSDRKEQAVVGEGWASSGRWPLKQSVQDRQCQEGAGSYWRRFAHNQATVASNTQK
jgi:hypothetical protein